MKLHYRYKEGFHLKHYILMWLDIPMTLLFLLIRIATLNLISTNNIEIKWVMFKLHNS